MRFARIKPVVALAGASVLLATACSSLDSPSTGASSAAGSAASGGTIPPSEIEGDCKLYPSTAYSDPAKLAGTNIAHGTVRVSQAASGVDVTLATRTMWWHRQIRTRFGWLHCLQRVEHK